MRVLTFGRCAVALVWLYQGAWCKLIAPARHAQVIAGVPGVGGSARLVLTTLGVIEAALALAVLGRFRPRLVALIGTMLIAAMNLGGLVFARDQIPDPAGMVVMNLAFLALVWVVADGDARTR